MVNYRRNRTRNGIYFFTVTLRDRRSKLLVQRVDALFQAWRRARRRVPHRLIAFVVMPEHLHAEVRMADDRDDYSRLVQDIKKGFTRRVAYQMESGRLGDRVSGSTPSAMVATCDATSITSTSIR